MEISVDDALAPAWLRIVRRLRGAGAPATQLWPRWLFLRLLGLGFACNFASLATQVRGLIGPHGILPAQDLLRAIADDTPAWRRLFEAPTLLWLGAGDRALALLCGAGFAAGLALLLGLWPRAALVACWASYLSFAAAARDFAGFQSDGLMLECALVGLWLAPRGLRPGLGAASPPSRVALVCARFLALRLILEAGLAKLASGDPSWRALTALDDYYQNCPFPSPLGWWVAHLPLPFHRAACLATLAIELGGPIAILVGPRPRAAAALAWIALQLGIAATASYTFLNGSAIALGLLLLDDQQLARWLRRPPPAPLPARPPPPWLAALAAVPPIAQAALATILYLAASGLPLPPLARDGLALTLPFRSANRYALFAAMTHQRDQLELEGSNDGGATWRSYRFRWQAQGERDPPRFMAPHLPRFDWNLWFATLEDWSDKPMVVETGARLIEGRREVARLFAADPFPDRPPDRIRFPLWRYRFADLAAHRATGAWWTRERIGDYAPMVWRRPDGTIALDSEPPTGKNAEEGP